MSNINMVFRESARRSHPLSHECDIVETCCMRLSLLQMTFGRYIEHKHISFFPGAVSNNIIYLNSRYQHNDLMVLRLEISK